MRALRNNKGFTLVEMLLAVLFGIIVMAGIGIAVQSVSRSGSSLERKVVAQQDVRAALELMAMEIGMASYNPTFAATSMWLNPNDCSAGTANNKGIQIATANSIAIEMDSNTEDGDVNDSNEIITYTYDTANEYISRKAGCNAGAVAQPFLGATSAPRGVKVINNTVASPATIPVFRYYDASGAETASIPDIRRIEITLVVEIDESGFTYTTTGTTKRRLVYSTSVLPRNHPINP